MKKAILAMVTVGALVTASPVEAQHVGGCPPGFTLTSVSELPPAVAGSPSADHNQDGLTCVKTLNNGGIFRDNTVGPPTAD